MSNVSNWFKKMPEDKKRKQIFRKCVRNTLKEVRGLFNNFKVVFDERADKVEIDIKTTDIKSLIVLVSKTGFNYEVSKDRVSIIVNKVSNNKFMPMFLNELFLSDEDLEKQADGIINEYIRKDDSGTKYVHNENYAKECVEDIFKLECIEKLKPILSKYNGIMRVKTPSIVELDNRCREEFDKLCYEIGGSMKYLYKGCIITADSKEEAVDKAADIKSKESKKNPPKEKKDSVDTLSKVNELINQEAEKIIKEPFVLMPANWKSYEKNCAGFSIGFRDPNSKLSSGLNKNKFKAFINKILTKTNPVVKKEKGFSSAKIEEISPSLVYRIRYDYKGK